MKKLTIEELKLYKYPNLMAEVQETTYSICTIAHHMGLDGYREAGDVETWEKITGRTEIYSTEGMALCRLFSVSFEYLFSQELKIVQGKTAAYWRWLDEHERVERDLNRSREISNMEKELRKKPYLIKFMKVAVTLNNEQVDDLVQMIERRKAGVDHETN